MNAPIVFLDLETTGLDPRVHAVWEIAVIRRVAGVDKELVWQVRPGMGAHLDQEALAVNGFEERFCVPHGLPAARIAADGRAQGVSMIEMLFDLQAALDGAHLVVNNPVFDIGFLSRLMYVHAVRLPWHYHVADIKSLAAGFLHGVARAGHHVGDVPDFPWSTRRLALAVGVNPAGPEFRPHTGLGDARLVRAVYDAISLGEQQGGHRKEPDQEPVQ